MAVEEASNVLVGDWIRIDYGGTDVDCEVSSTEHGPSSVVIGVTLADEYRLLEFLPDDSVMVTFYGEECYEEVE